jgi:hypothetical protein
VSGAAVRRAVAACGEDQGEAKHKRGRQRRLPIGADTRVLDQRLLPATSEEGGVPLEWPSGAVSVGPTCTRRGIRVAPHRASGDDTAGVARPAEMRHEPDARSSSSDACDNCDESPTGTTAITTSAQWRVHSGRTAARWRVVQPWCAYDVTVETCAESVMTRNAFRPSAGGGDQPGPKSGGSHTRAAVGHTHSRVMSSEPEEGGSVSFRATSSDCVPWPATPRASFSPCQSGG